jgi:hypothetical protein
MDLSIPYAQAFLITLLFLIVTTLYNKHKWNKTYKLPPGPKGLPYFGNMFQIPSYHQGPWAKQLAEKYGEM